MTGNNLLLEQTMVRVRRAASLAALALILVAARAAAQQPGTPAQPLRFAWLNSERILANTPGRAAAESLFATEMTGARAEVQRLQVQLDSAVAEYQRASVTMSPTAKTQREDQLRQMEGRNRQRAQDLDQQMQQRQQELTAPIMQRVNGVIEGIRAEFNYAIIFDVAAQGNSIVTADQTLEITNLVIQRLQAAGPGPAPGPPSATAPPADSTRNRPAPVGPRVRPRP